MFICSIITYRNLGATGIVFTSSPVDMTQYTNKWAELNTSDFYVGTSSLSISVSSTGGEDYGSSGSFTVAPTFSYDSTTGTLTFDNVSWSKSFCDNSSYNTKAKSNGSGNTFVVWLGTANGE